MLVGFTYKPTVASRRYPWLHLLTIATGGGDTSGVRVIADPVVLKLLTLVGATPDRLSRQRVWPMWIPWASLPPAHLPHSVRRCLVAPLACPTICCEFNISSNQDRPRMKYLPQTIGIECVTVSVSESVISVWIRRPVSDWVRLCVSVWQWLSPKLSQWQCRVYHFGAS